MQENFRSASHFSQRTESLAVALGVHLKELPSRLGFSERMLFGYRSGKYPITGKAWRKLEQAEREARLAPGSTLRAAAAISSTQEEFHANMANLTHAEATIEAALGELGEIRARVDALEHRLRGGLGATAVRYPASPRLTHSPSPVEETRNHDLRFEKRNRPDKEEP